MTMRKPIFSQTNLFGDSSNCALSGSFHEVTRPLTRLQEEDSPSYAVQSDHDVFYCNGRKIDFDIGGSQLHADITDGNYRGPELAGVIAGAMNDAAGVTDIGCDYIWLDDLSIYGF